MNSSDNLLLRILDTVLANSMNFELMQQIRSYVSAMFTCIMEGCGKIAVDVFSLLGLEWNRYINRMLLLAMTSETIPITYGYGAHNIFLLNDI